MTDEIKKTSDSGDAEEAELEKLKAKIATVEKERDEFLNGWKRAQADLINYQKDETRRLSEISKFGNESILEEIVSILDNFNHGLSAAEKVGAKTDQGLYLIRNQLEELLRKRGVIKIEARPGEVYDPMYHEAIQMVDEAEVDGKKIESGHIAAVLEPGYMIHAKVLKPARVKVTN